MKDGWKLPCGFNVRGRLVPDPQEQVQSINSLLDKGLAKLVKNCSVGPWGKKDWASDDMSLVWDASGVEADLERWRTMHPGALEEKTGRTGSVGGDWLILWELR